MDTDKRHDMHTYIRASEREHIHKNGIVEFDYLKIHTLNLQVEKRCGIFIRAAMKRAGFALAIMLYCYTDVTKIVVRHKTVSKCIVYFPVVDVTPYNFVMIFLCVGFSFLSCYLLSISICFH